MYPWMLAHTYNSRTQQDEAEDYYKFNVSLGYMLNFMIAWATD